MNTWKNQYKWLAGGYVRRTLVIYGVCSIFYNGYLKKKKFLPLTLVTQAIGIKISPSLWYGLLLSRYLCRKTEFSSLYCICQRTENAIKWKLVVLGHILYADICVFELKTYWKMVQVNPSFLASFWGDFSVLSPISALETYIIP